MNSIKFTVCCILLFQLLLFLNFNYLYAKEQLNNFETTFYGEGVSEKNFDKATELALKDVYNNIFLNTSISNTDRNRIKLYINLPSYTIFENKNVKNKYYKIVIGINKKELIDIQKTKFDEYVKILDSKIQKFETINDFFKREFYNKNILPTLNDIENMIFLIKIIDTTFQDKKYIKMVENIKNECDKYMKKITVGLKFENGELNILSNDIENYLSKNDIYIDNKAQNTLLFSVNNVNTMIDNLYNVVSNFTVKLINSDNKIILYESKVFQCQSKLNYFDCLDKNIVDFRKHINSNDFKLIKK